MVCSVILLWRFALHSFNSFARLASVAPVIIIFVAPDVAVEGDDHACDLSLCAPGLLDSCSYAFIARCLARHGLSGALYLDSISVLATDPRHSSSLVLLSYKSLLKRLGPAVVFIMLPFILLNLVLAPSVGDGTTGIWTKIISDWG